MKILRSKEWIIKWGRPEISIVLIGLPRFCLTLEHNCDKDGNWETALCIFIFGITFRWWNWGDK